MCISCCPAPLPLPQLSLTNAPSKWASAFRHSFAPPAEVNPDYTRLAARFFDSAGRLLPSALDRFDEFLTAATGLDPDLKVGPDVPGFLAAVRDARQRAHHRGHTSLGKPRVRLP